MSGHSKWSTIKRKKEARDHARGNVFTKLANAIVVAVKKGGSGDPETNFALRLAIDKARAANMPNDNINRAIDRGLGKGSDGKIIEEMLFEGYGPGGVAMVVETVTDNRNRTLSEVKTIFDKSGGKPAQPGSVLYQFERVGAVSYEGLVDDETYLELIDKGLIDMEQEDAEGVIFTAADAVEEITKILMSKNLKNVSGEVTYKSKHIEPNIDADKIESLMDKLRDLDDVQEVYAAI